MNAAILIRLIAAHLLSDFVLQTDKICEGKKCGSKGRFAWQALHSFIHALSAYLLVAEWNVWIVPIAVFLTHFMIDCMKVEFMKESSVSFVVDQLAHLIVLLVLWLLVFSDGMSLLDGIAIEWNNMSVWIVVTAYILILKPTSVFLSLFIRKWAPSEVSDESLPNAGKWIGYLERVLILTFIFTGNAEGIGFLLAAKSIFRFGELSKAKEIRTTEYVLIGTLASFVVAVVVGCAGQYLRQL